jgi:hypothetical protein
VLAAGALALVVTVVAAPAEAVTCTKGTRFTSTSISSSTKFDATSACDGVYAGSASSRCDSIRGRFYNDRAWQTSTYGWVWVSTTDDGYDKVVGNTVTGRDIKGQAKNFAQNVSYLY